MRHKTTAYDSIKIPRIKFRRREIRGKLAKTSIKVLKSYRKGLDIDRFCPLKRALDENPA